MQKISLGIKCLSYQRSRPQQEFSGDRFKFISMSIKTIDFLDF